MEKSRLAWVVNGFSHYDKECKECLALIVTLAGTAKIRTFGHTQPLESMAELNDAVQKSLKMS
jgi:hypothetical protein